MKREEKHTEELFLKALSGELNPEEQIQWERLIQEDPEWDSRKKELSNFYQEAKHVKSEFPPFFSTRVMARIQKEESSLLDFIPNAFWWVASPALALIAGLFLYIGVSAEGQLSLDTIAGTDEVYVEELIISDIY